MYVLPLQPYIFLLKLILEIRASHATYGVLNPIQVLALFHISLTIMGMKTV